MTGDIVLWGLPPSILVDRCWCFGAMSCLHLYH